MLTVGCSVVHALPVSSAHEYIGLSIWLEVSRLLLR